METIQSHVSRLAVKSYLKSKLSVNPQIRTLGQYDPIGDNYKRPRALLKDWSRSEAKHFKNTA
jgi:hypothetical protein